MTISIKGTDKDMKCRDFQFEIDKTYTIQGPIVACKSGFHACPVDQHPLSVFDYYSPALSRYFETEQSGESREDGDKLASASISLKIEISLGDLIQRAVKWVFDHSVPENSATGHQGAASATGYRGAASATGHQGAASATGDQGAASATGYRGAASATGYRGAASATGYQGAASVTGYQGAASATGNQGVALAIGVDCRAMATETNGICLACRDEKTGKILALEAAMCGEKGVESGKWYRLTKDRQFVECAS